MSTKAKFRIRPQAGGLFCIEVQDACFKYWVPYRLGFKSYIEATNYYSIYIGVDTGYAELIDYKETEQKRNNMGYHLKTITKGKYGEVSKIREELEELEDALEQNIKIMVFAELSDLYGALRAFALKHNLSLKNKKASEFMRRMNCSIFL